MSEPPPPLPPVPDETAAADSKPQPAPAPTVADRFHAATTKAKAVAVSLAGKSKSAAQIIANQTERTKLTKLTLPNAYRALGKHVHGADSFRADFGEIYERIDELLADVSKLTATGPAVEGFKERAMAVAKATKDKTHAQALQLKLRHEYNELGRSVLEKHGQNSGPPNVVNPILNCRALLEALEADTAEVSKSESGTVLTPKRIAIGGLTVANLLLLLVVTVMFFGGRTDNGQVAKNDAAETRQPAAIQNAEAPKTPVAAPATTSLGAEGPAYYGNRGNGESLCVTPTSTSQDAQAQASPPLHRSPAVLKAAIYRVRITPSEAILAATGAGVTVAGEGGERTVTVVAPDGRTKLLLLASLAGYENQQRELKPFAGESRTIVIQLLRSTNPSSPLPPPTDPLSVAGEMRPRPAQEFPPSRRGPLPMLTNSIGLQLVEIPPGEFLMGAADPHCGASDEEKGRRRVPRNVLSSGGLEHEATEAEKPQHRVQITRPFYLGVFEVTQAQYQRIMGNNPSRFKEDSGSSPVEMVSWRDAEAFCVKLSSLADEMQAGRQYRLPSEAEWEYACRAGTTSRYGFDETTEYLDSYAWYHLNSELKTHPVGQKKPNSWGLYDMHGNVREWCNDWFGLDEFKRYANQKAIDPQGPKGAMQRAVRGGDWRGWGCCRSSYRSGVVADDRAIFLGFRVAAVTQVSSGR